CAHGLRLACEHPRSRDYQRRGVFSDSRYVVDNWRSATDSWPNSGWRTREGAPVLNVELWREMGTWVVRTERRGGWGWGEGAEDGRGKGQAKQGGEQAGKRAGQGGHGAALQPASGCRTRAPEAHQELRATRQRSDARAGDPGSDHNDRVPAGAASLQVQVRGL